MKVSRQPIEPEFKPITIIIETKKEADCLWHRLNAGDFTFRGYCAETRVNEDVIASYAMFVVFSEIYNPNRGG